MPFVGGPVQTEEQLEKGRAIFQKHDRLLYMGAPSFFGNCILRMYAYKIEVYKDHLPIRHFLAYNCKSPVSQQLLFACQLRISRVYVTFLPNY
jgi:hypothetical protein